MNLFDDILLIERLDYLIRVRATGTSGELANRFDISKRKAERLISKLREMGFPVSYDKESKTYYYTEEVRIYFEIKIGKNQLFQIKGGT